MPSDTVPPERALVPTLRYRDVAAAIDWLCNAFGFEQRLVVSGDDGSVRYAELTFGNGMIMLGPVEDSAIDNIMTQPADNGGAETQICYIFIADAAAHRDRARAAGAEIVLDIVDEHSNGCGYSCRDLEGHIWNFGTYDPWKRQARPAGRSSLSSSDDPRRGLRRLGLVAGLFGVVAVSALVVGWALGVIDVGDLGLRSAASTSLAEAVASPQRDPLTHERETAERAVKTATEQLAKERVEREAAERFARSAREQLGQERGARETAERAAKEIQARLTEEQSAREAAERAVKQANDPAARADAERALEGARQQLAGERSALEETQRITQEMRERLALVEHSADLVIVQLVAEQTAREAAERATSEAQQALEKLVKERLARKRKRSP